MFLNAYLEFQLVAFLDRLKLVLRLIEDLFLFRAIHRAASVSPRIHMRRSYMAQIRLVEHYAPTGRLPGG
jgi:hypothetical protein